jgi:BirA family transcriptional regulator, biotin operon repressor / biotin---[acetyl-CoA-carboxylase] ligase
MAAGGSLGEVLEVEGKSKKYRVCNHRIGTFFPKPLASNPGRYSAAPEQETSNSQELSMATISPPPGPDPLWQKLAAGSFAGRPARLLASTGSTNSDALALGRQGGAAGTLVVAETQNGGRGRLGRHWLSPPGAGLYFSLILRPRLAPADFPKITLAAGLAVCQAVEAETGLAPAIKWPNDLLLAGRKFCGILTEGEPLAAAGPLAVLGIGLNVSTTPAAFPDELRASATSLLAHSGKLYARGALLAAILTRLTATLSRLEEGDFPQILAEWRRRDALAGHRLTWLTPTGSVVTGIALGPDGEGTLHLRDDAGRMHEVLSGDLRLAGR